MGVCGSTANRQHIRCEDRLSNQPVRRVLRAQRSESEYSRSESTISIDYEQRQRLLVVRFCEPLFPNLAADLMRLIWLYTLEYFTLSHPVFVSINDEFKCQYQYIATTTETTPNAPNTTSPSSDGATYHQHTPTLNPLSPSLHTSHCTKSYKIMVLGGALSGKSTICNQLRTCYGQRYSRMELQSLRPYLTQNVFEAMKSLCRFHKQIESKDPQTALRAHNVAIRDAMCSVQSRTTFTRSHFTELQQLWHDDGLQHTYKHYRHKFFICDNAPYWFARMAEYWRSSFVPSMHDGFLNRQRTTGVHQIKLICPSSFRDQCTYTEDRISLYDVGGAQTERRRWTNFFQDTHAIMFVIGLNSFCRSLWENNRVNRLQDEIQLFKEIVNRPEFRNTPIVVLLNKVDVLMTDMQHFRFADFVSDFDGDSDSVKDIIEYICGKLLLQQNEKDNQRNDKRIHFIATNATNTECIKNVFDFIREKFNILPEQI